MTAPPPAAVPCARPDCPYRGVVPPVASRRWGAPQRYCSPACALWARPQQRAARAAREKRAAARDALPKEATR